MVSKIIKQNQLTAECWAVQMWGTSRCTTCEFKDTKECGGKAILETGRNSLGMFIGATGLNSGI